MALVQLLTNQKIIRCKHSHAPRHRNGHVKVRWHNDLQIELFQVMFEGQRVKGSSCLSSRCSPIWMVRCRRGQLLNETNSKIDILYFRYPGKDKKTTESVIQYFVFIWKALSISLISLFSWLLLNIENTRCLFYFVFY